MTNASKTIIKDKLLDLKERTKKQTIELQEEIGKKKKRFEALFQDLDMNTSNPILALSGALAFAHIFGAILKGRSLIQVVESLRAVKLLREKDIFVEKLYNQVSERISIIETAEKNDLENFLKTNDVYSIFENGKLEKFLEDNDSSKKEKTKTQINSEEMKNKDKTPFDEDSKEKKPEKLKNKVTYTHEQER